MYLRQLLLIQLSLLALLFSGCNASLAPKEISYENRVSTPVDSVHKVSVQAVVESLNARIRADSQSHFKFLYPVLTPNDTLEYWVVDNEPVRLNIILNHAGNTYWPTLYIKNDTLIQARHRQHIRNDTANYALETMMYMQSGKIAFAEERKVELKDNELPALIRLQPFIISPRKFGELEHLYQEYYPSLKLAAKAHYAQPKK